MGDKVIGRGRTADNHQIALWGDGSLTWGGLGRIIRGSPAARTPEQVELARTAGWLVLGDCSLYDANEIPDLIKAARRTAARGGNPGEMRASLAKSERRAKQWKPVWQTYQADRDGRPTVRIWRLSRLTHPGLVIWDEPRGTGARGRYQVMTEIGRSGTLATTGVQFDDLEGLSRYLDETRKK